MCFTVDGIDSSNLRRPEKILCVYCMYSNVYLLRVLGSFSTNKLKFKEVHGKKYVNVIFISLEIHV